MWQGTPSSADVAGVQTHISRRLVSTKAPSWSAGQVCWCGREGETLHQATHRRMDLQQHVTYLILIVETPINAANPLKNETGLQLRASLGRLPPIDKHLARSRGERTTITCLGQHPALHLALQQYGPPPLAKVDGIQPHRAQIATHGLLTASTNFPANRVQLGDEDNL
jgi:hypothetical protein